MAFATIMQEKLLVELQFGLPICANPYLAIAEKIGCEQEEVIEGIKRLKQQKFIKRFGVVVKHRKLGYQSNAMVVWNIADEEVDKYGELFSREDCVTLCYQRPRQLPHWPYNLFTMIHGKKRADVLEQIQQLIDKHQIKVAFEVLFSTKCFKQRGAVYHSEKTKQPDR